VVVNAQECQHGDELCKSSVSIAIMSWCMHKNIVMPVNNLYNGHDVINISVVTIDFKALDCVEGIPRTGREDLYSCSVLF